MSKLIHVDTTPGKVATTTKLKAPTLWRSPEAGMLTPPIQDAEYVEIVERAPEVKTLHLRVSFDGLNDALVVVILPSIIALSLLVGFAVLNTSKQPVFLVPSNSIQVAE